MNVSNLNVLLLEDESFVRQLTTQALQCLGVERVESASDGIVALGKLMTSETPYDVIICDLNLPDMDGVEFIRHAHASNYEGSMIIYSGQDQRMLDATVELARSHDINVLGAIQKPLKVKDLGALLDNFSVPAVKLTDLPQQSINLSELVAGIAADDACPVKLVYQPKIHVRSGRIVGVEALARWDHGTRGILGPHTFIPLAEHKGLIDDLSRIIFRKAVMQVAEWAKRGLDLKVSVNFSINSFNDIEFTDFIESTIDEFKVDPSLIDIEVTESQVMENSLNCMEMMLRMRLKKFGLSIDDFGTGNSSMAQLKQIPFTELKIDRAFVHKANANASARAILEASVDLGKKLNMQIVAEGAETKEDWDLVETLGCDLVQGYYCAKPMLPADLEIFHHDWDGPHSMA